MEKLRVLAERIAKLLFDFDTYEFNDTFENEEEAINHIEEMLTDYKQIQALIAFCNDILESDNDEFYKEAEEIKSILCTL